MILLIIGFILIGSEFGAKTVYTSIMVPAFMGAFEWIFPNFQSLTGDPFLDAMCYILVVGMAMAILFSKNASSGGLDIFAKNKLTKKKKLVTDEQKRAFLASFDWNRMTVQDESVWEAIFDCLDQ